MSHFCCRPSVPPQRQGQATRGALRAALTLLIRPSNGWLVHDDAGAPARPSPGRRPPAIDIPNRLGVIETSDQFEAVATHSLKHILVSDEVNVTNHELSTAQTRRRFHTMPIACSIPLFLADSLRFRITHRGTTFRLRRSPLPKRRARQGLPAKGDRARPARLMSRVVAERSEDRTTIP